MASTLVANLSADFDPAKYRDTYREKLEALVSTKREGKETVAVNATRAAPVVDITEALQKSLAALKKPATAAGAPVKRRGKHGSSSRRAS